MEWALLIILSFLLACALVMFIWGPAPIALYRARYKAWYHCPHQYMRGVSGDEINHVGGWRLQCLVCERYLDGPASLANCSNPPDDERGMDGRGALRRGLRRRAQRTT